MPLETPHHLVVMVHPILQPTRTGPTLRARPGRNNAQGHEKMNNPANVEDKVKHEHDSLSLNEEELGTTDLNTIATSKRRLRSFRRKGIDELVARKESNRPEIASRFRSIT
jgi:hypothetical protein